MTDRWVTIHNADTPVEAQAALDYLHAHDVAARSRVHPDPHLAGAPVSPGWGVIQVRAVDQAEGRELLRRWDEEPPRTLVESVESVESRQPSPPLLGHAPPREEPRWAQTRSSAGWLWWAFIVSLAGNVLFAGLWWEAERRQTAGDSAP